MSVPNSNWKTTTMTAISKLRMSGPYRPGWEKSWPYHVSVKVPPPGPRERKPPRGVGKPRQDRTEVELTDVRLNLAPVQEIDEGHRHRIWMAFDDARREHDGDQEALSPEEREIERDPRALFQVEQRDAFVAQRDVERPVDDAENVRAGIGRLDDRVGQGSSPGGGRDILEEQDGVDAIVAQERVRKSERRVEGREIRGGTELGVVHFHEGAPREGVP